MIIAYIAGMWVTHLPNWNYFRFLYASETATPGDVKIIAVKKVKKVYSENMSIAVGILFLCAFETK